MNELFQEALYVLEQIERNGYKAYFVGGCVRDYVLDRPIKDIDIASNAKPEDIQRIFPKTIPVGIEHGTVIVRHNHISYEVTTFRKEDQYEDYRRPSNVWFVDDLEEDLSRRDFTFNAMAMDRSFQIIDPFSGREDLKVRQIRTVGDPHLRFSEDPLRLMRACRFMSIYDMGIEKETEEAILKKASFLKRISTERITEEFKKLLEGKQAGKALEFMRQSAVLTYLPYVLEENEREAYKNFRWNSLQNEEQRWTAVILLSNIGDVKEFLKSWKLPNTTIRKVLNLLSAYQKQTWTRMDLYRAGIEAASASVLLKSLLENRSYDEDLAGLHELARTIPISSRKDIPLDGEDIISIKQQSPGVWVGKLFDEMEKKIVEGDLALKESELKDWVKRWEP